MKTTIHCDERITNIRNTIYVKLFWGIIPSLTVGK